MQKFIENQIFICENSKLYIYAEFYRNILIQFNKLNLTNFNKLLNYNLDNSPNYFRSELLKLTNF
jgi:hypothetical protein